jgi:hypothetical protein
MISLFETRGFVSDSNSTEVEGAEIREMLSYGTQRERESAAFCRCYLRGAWRRAAKRRTEVCPDDKPRL